MYYCLQGSYVFSYTINKLSCLSVLLNNTRNISEAFFPFHNAFSCFLFSGKKANRNLRGMADSWPSINRSKPTDKWLTREPLLTVTQRWGHRKNTEGKKQGQKQKQQNREQLLAGCPLPGALIVKAGLGRQNRSQIFYEKAQLL